MIDPKLLEEAVKNVYMRKFASELREMLVFSKSKELSEVWKEYEKLTNEKPKIKPGAIVRCMEDRPGCEKILGGLCDCGRT